LIWFTTAAVVSPALAANGTWSSTASTGAWQTTTNWISGLVPGATSGIANTDTALFNSASTTTTIVPDATRNLQNITFDTAAAAYTIGTIGGHSLLLTNVGQIQVAATFSGSNATETVDAPLVLEGSYTFANISTIAGVLLDFGGPISTDGNPLTMSGPGNISISGNISGIGSVNKTGSGTVYLTGTNSYSGGTMVTAGILVTNTLGDPTSPIVVSAAAGVNSALVLGGGQQGQTVGSLTGTVAVSGSALVSISSDDTLTVDQATNTTFGGTIWNSGTLIKSGAGTLEITGAPTWSDLSSIRVNSGRLRFNVTSGSPSIGAGVETSLSSGATLELAGSVSALANGANRVNITNNSTAPGVLVSGTHQQVGNIDGSGTTQVNAGSDFTANHIVQSALVIGGTSRNPGLVTIDASDASGNPFDQSNVVPTRFSAAGAPGQEPILIAGGSSSSSIFTAGGETFGGPIPASGGTPSDSPAVVSEPSSLLFVGLALGCGMAAKKVLRRLLPRLE
jgi:autotransporter-associated beta strand protein